MNNTDKPDRIIDIGVVMDPIESITPYKDSTLAMMLAAAANHWRIWYMQPADLFLHEGTTHASRTRIEVFDDNDRWFELAESATGPLAELDIVLMRKDPPFDMDYIYTTYLLERAETDGLLISNKPSSLRDVNEKFYTAWFSEFCPPTLVSMASTRIRAFLETHGDIVVKPLDGMGGESIFRLKCGDPNTNVILETITHRDSRQIMAQKFLPEIVDGDKRILVVDGEPMDYALARIPAQGETRGNLAAGGRGEPVPISDNDRRIVDNLRPALLQKDLLFVGVDVIGNYMTEINVTSPTCIREIDAHANLDIAGRYLAALAKRL